MAEERPIEDLNEGELEIKHDEFAFWMRNRVTQEYRRRMLAQFDHQKAILALGPQPPEAQLFGRAEVLEYVIDPHKLLMEE